ncbi:hypothetical protein GCM10027605_19870 [Micromonospora zhanjiangensis]
MLTWPKFTVSRIGSKAAARQTATASANQRVQPCRRASGSTSHHSSSTLTTTVAVTLTTIETSHGRYAIGSIVNAANGG